MRILALETSCDETAAAVIEDGRVILSNVVASQIELHARYGGVFPEAASRQHVLSIDGVTRRALQGANVDSAAELDGLAVTCGPGLVGSLMVGVNMAKGMQLATGLPLQGINHLAGHVYSLWLQPDAQTAPPEPRFPLVVLIASGGHTDLILMTDFEEFESLGSTLDDAAGEAFDKVARILGLGYPGGPAVQQAAAQGDATRHELPYPLQGRRDLRFDFSFSGLKTFMLHEARRAGLEAEDPAPEPSKAARDLAAAFEKRMAQILMDRVEDAVEVHGAAGVGLCGGVSANARLRQTAEERCRRLDVPLHIPPLFLCTDNAAMIGAAAFFRGQHGGLGEDGLALDVHARWPLGGALQHPAASEDLPPTGLPVAERIR